MVIGDFVGYSSLGLGSLRGGAMGRDRQHNAVAFENKTGVTLDAKLDPKSPNEYTVQVAPKGQEVIRASEKPSDVKSVAKRLNNNHDPVSRAFFSVADYSPKIHKIDISI